MSQALTIAVNLRIVLLPDQSGEMLSKKMSSEIGQKVPTDFVLDDLHIPHVTMLALESTADNLLIQKVLEDMANQFKHLYSQARVVIQEDNRSYIGFYFDENLGKQVEEMRRMILEKLNDVKGVTNRVLDNPVPHITLTHLKNEQDSKQFGGKWPLANAQIDLQFLALAVEGENFGTCQEIVEKFELKS